VFSAGGSTSSQGGGGKVIVPIRRSWGILRWELSMAIMPDQHKLIIASSVCLSRQSIAEYLSVRSKQGTSART